MVHGLFEGVDKADPNLEFSIKVSYVEIYMETIRDLLEPSSINLQVRIPKPYLSEPILTIVAPFGSCI